MTTENENTMRELGVLLALDTYQGMSDEEIDSIIKYKENIAYNRGNSDALSSQAMINVMDNKRIMDELFSRVERVLNYKREEGDENE
jgi:hypothetical protein